MRRGTLLIAVLVAAIAAAMFIRQPKATKTPRGEPHRDRTGIRFKEMEKQFGVVYPSVGQLESTFAFSNVGGRRETLKIVSQSCTCTKAELDNAVYSPGENGTLKLSWRVPSTPGDHLILVTLRSEEAPDDMMQISMQATVKHRFIVEPSQLVMKGIPPGQTVKKRIVLRAPAGTELDPSQIRAEFESDVQNVRTDVEVVNPGQVTVDIVVQGSESAERALTRLKVFTGDRDEPFVSIPVEFQFLSELEAFPPAFVLRRSDEAFSKDVELVKNSVGNLVIDRVECDHPEAIDISEVDAGDRRRAYRLKCKPSKAENREDKSRLAGRLQVFVSNRTEPVVIRYVIVP